MAEKHIFLYADDFDIDVWKHYCSILEVPEDSFEISIGFDTANVEVMT